MRVFTRVVERRSFTLAAQDLGLPRSTVTDAVKRLEARLGVRLLQRTTRHVSATLDGEAYHRRCLALIADLEDAEAAFGGAKPKGLLRVDVHGTLARHFVLPRLPDFLAEYPDIELYMSEGDRLVDLVREGIDCVLRVGDLQDSDMVARRVTMLTEMTCAAPAYINRFGTPAIVDALDGHRMVGFRSSAMGPSSGCGGGRRGGKPCRRRKARSGADPGAAVPHRKRFVERNADYCPARRSALADAGVVALSPQPAAFTARPRVHRLARPGVWRRPRLRLRGPVVCPFSGP